MAQFGSHQKGSVNVELNIVPFIDLMSCMTAFLLVTAVWIDQTQIPTEAAGRGPADKPTTEPPALSVLVESDQILVTATPGGEVTQLAANDWQRLAQTLGAHQHDPEMPQVRVGASSSDAHPVSYQSLIAAMDTAVKAGFPDVRVADPASLRP